MAQAAQPAGRDSESAKILSLAEIKALRSNLSRSLLNEEERRAERNYRAKYLEARAMDDKHAQLKIIRDYIDYQKRLKTRLALSKSEEAAAR